MISLKDFYLLLVKNKTLDTFLFFLLDALSVFFVNAIQ